jgi:hypothetical protein
MGLFGPSSAPQNSSDAAAVARFNRLDAQQAPMSSELNARLLQAISDNMPGVVRQALEKGASPEIPWNGSSLTGLPVLAYAVNNNMEPVVRALLDHGADPNRDMCSVTMLWYATRNGNSRVVRMLLDAGAEPSGKAREMRWQDWPLEIAKKNYYTDIVQMLEQEPSRRAQIAAAAAQKKEEAEKAAAQALQEQQRAATAAEVTQRITVSKPLVLKGVKPAAAPKKGKLFGWLE